MEGSSPAIYTDFLVFLFLLFMSGFFASSEVVFFSVSKPFLMRFSNSRFYSILLRIISKPKEVLISILIGNEIVNVMISSYGASLFTSLFGKGGAFLSAVVMSLLIFIFGETLPKNAVLPLAPRLSLIYAPVFYVFHILITPIRIILFIPVQGFLAKLGVKLEEEKYELSEEKLLSLLETGVENGNFSGKEKEMVEKALEMDEMLVREIMTPRPDMFALEENKKVGEVIEDIKRYGHSKFPIYENVLDHITGVVSIKDLLPARENADRPLKDFAKEPLIVPEVMSVASLLKEFRKSGTHLAVVVDEHGAVSGVITLYDILKWMLGDVPEEWEEEKDMVKLSKDTYKVSGSADIEEIAEELGFELPEDYDYDTVGGFVMANLEKIPERGDEFEYGGFKFVVEEMEGNRVKEVVIHSLQSREKVQSNG